MPTGCATARFPPRQTAQGHQTQIDHLDLDFPGVSCGTTQEDVLGLDVAVDQIVLVGVLQGNGDAAGNFSGVGNPQRTEPQGHVAEIHPFDIFGDQILLDSRRARVPGGNNVRIDKLPNTFISRLKTHSASGRRIASHAVP